MDNAVGQYGNVSDGSVLLPNSLDENNAIATNYSQSPSPDIMTTSERIAGSPTTEDRLSNTPSTTEKLSGAIESSTTRADEVRQVEETWEKLRSYPEIKAIEDKAGKIKLTIDYTKETGYIKKRNEIIFNPAHLKEVEYKTVINETIESSLTELPEKEYWEFMDNYPKSYPFSFERMLVHEANHALQPDNRLLYTINSSQIEAPVINRTNEFMWNNFKEPARDPNWH